MQIRSAKDLKVYQRAYALAMDIFNISKTWQREEKYSLECREVGAMLGSMIKNPTPFLIKEIFFLTSDL